MPPRRRRPIISQLAGGAPRSSAAIRGRITNLPRMGPRRRSGNQAARRESSRPLRDWWKLGNVARNLAGGTAEAVEDAGPNGSVGWRFEGDPIEGLGVEIGRASCRERV